METKTTTKAQVLEATTVTATPLVDGRYEYVVTYADGSKGYTQKSKRRYEAALAVWSIENNRPVVHAFSGSRQNAAKHPNRNWDIWEMHRVIDVKHV